VASGGIARGSRLSAGFNKNGIVMARIRMYATGWCPYCIRAEQLLRAKGVTEIEKLRVDVDPPLKDKMIAETGRRTVPQIFIGDLHVGGFDDMAELDRRGELDSLLSAP